MKRISLMVLAAVLSGGCYHVTVVTGAPPSTTVIDKEWQYSFVAGLVPPPEIAANDKCTQGVAKVETERSFLNALVGAVTYNIFTPMHTKVTCAGGPIPR